MLGSWSPVEKIKKGHNRAGVSGKILSDERLRYQVMGRLKLRRRLSIDKISEDKPVVKLVDTIIFDAISQRAATYLETCPDGLTVKYRIDSVIPRHELLRSSHRHRLRLRS